MATPFADGEPDAKRARPSLPAGEEGEDTLLLIETQGKNARNSMTFALNGLLATELARAITGSTDDPFGRLCELAREHRLLTVPRKFFVKYCFDVWDDMSEGGDMLLDNFLRSIDKKHFFYIVDSRSSMMGTCCSSVQNLVHIRSTPLHV